MRKPLHIIVLCLALTCCRQQSDTGGLNIAVSHSANGQEIALDTVFYVNEAGNRFTVSEIQYFISNIGLQNEKGEWAAIDTGHNTHYIDTDIAESKSLVFSDIKADRYTKIRFTFGLDEADNATGRFNNPPEANMFWPEPLGGGYHYMKLNGKWLDDEGHLQPMNIHLGIGQDSTLTEFYHNHFQVELPIDINIVEDRRADLQLNMLIDNWFKSPNTINLAEYGSAIMQNQTAQSLFKANGNDVFQIMP